MQPQHYIYPQSILTNTPSIKSGLLREIEINNRIYGCELISYIGIRLSLTSLCICTAQYIFQRFYYHQSMYEYKLIPVILASILLATKLDDEPRSIKDIILT